MNKEEIILELEEFSLSELKEIRAAIDFSILLKQNKKESATLDLLYTIIIKKLMENNLIDKHLALVTFKKANPTSYKALLKLHEYLDGYLLLILERNPTKNEKAKFYGMYVSTMLVYIGNLCTPTLPLLLNGYSNFPSALGANFPGYAEGGLLKVIFQGLQ